MVIIIRGNTENLHNNYKNIFRKVNIILGYPTKNVSPPLRKYLFDYIRQKLRLQIANAVLKQVHPGNLFPPYVDNSCFHYGEILLPLLCNGGDIDDLKVKNYQQYCIRP